MDKPYYQDEFCTIYHGDCREILPTLEPVDLVLTDPPYGLGIAANPVRQAHAAMRWDNAVPCQQIFDEVFRISKEQIIWGG